jgi:hypothetical protein
MKVDRTVEFLRYAGVLYNYFSTKNHCLLSQITISIFVIKWLITIFIVSALVYNPAAPSTYVSSRDHSADNDDDESDSDLDF